MASYEIIIKRSAEKELRKVPRTALTRIMARIGGLASNPRPPGFEKLSAREEFRVRLGDYRIVCDINDATQLVTVVKTGHRREVYRR